MNRRNKILLSIILGIVLIPLVTLLFYWKNIFDDYGYAKAVHEEVRRNLARHKNYFKSFTFRGIIEEKNSPNEEGVREFRILISLDTLSKIDSSMMNSWLDLYYSLKKENKLQLTVTEDFFRKVAVGDSIFKEPNTLKIIFNKAEFQLISDEVDKWLE